MTIDELEIRALEKIREALGTSMSDDEAGAVGKIIKDVLIKAVLKTSERCSKAAVVCCGPEADMAHQISESVRLERKALIANLMSSP